MKAVIQRAKHASCTVDGTVTGSIDDGLVVYFGVDSGDDESILPGFINKMLKLRIFEDEKGKMNLSIKDINGSILFISQFTLSADVYHGNRPSFDSAEKPEKAERMYMKAAELIRNEGINTELGVFGAHMEIEYMNPGPATFILDSSCFSDAQTRRKNGKDYKAEYNFAARFIHAFYSVRLCNVGNRFE